MISDNYIKFSSELLRLSLLAMGGFGTLVLIKLKEPGNNQSEFLKEPIFFLISTLLFAFSSTASLLHRYYASDSMSWYISLLRADGKCDVTKTKKERDGLNIILKRAQVSLKVSEYLFVGAVMFFIVAIFKLFVNIDLNHFSNSCTCR